jgi:long-chain acyl-CoA synthetase
MMPNVLQYPVALFGILRAGMTVVNVNPLYTPRELKNILVDSGARCIVVMANFAHTVQEVLPDTKVQYVVATQIGDLLGGVKGHVFNLVTKYVKKLVPAWDIPSAYTFKQVIAPENKSLYEPVALTHDDLAFLQYTGATTGGPKGVMLTHGNMVANVLQAYTWIQSLIRQNLEGGIVTALPLYHIFSLTANCLVFLKVGIENILITNPRDIPLFIKELKRQPFCNFHRRQYAI